MKLFYPDVFEKFYCIGSKCKDNCCKIGWDIEIDDDTLSFYQGLEDDLGKKIVSNIYTEDGCHYMKQDNGCPFLNEKGLCSVLLKYGEDKISEICAQHPRFYEWFGNYKEAGVGLCCEKTCDLVLNHPEPIEFLSKEIDEEDDDLEFDKLLFDKLLKVRSDIISAVQNRNLSIKERLRFTAVTANKIQDILESEDYSEFDNFTEYMQNYELPEKANKKDAYVRFADFFKSLDYIHGSFEKQLEKAEQNLDKILEIEKDFDQSFSDRNYVYEHIAVYNIYRYLLKAVRNGDGCSPLMYGVVNVLAVRFIAMSEYAENGKLSDEDLMLIIKEYSKEVEYSADNMEKLSDEIYFGYKDGPLCLKNIVELIG